jgi:hypothetical protein
VGGKKRAEKKSIYVCFREKFLILIFFLGEKRVEMMKR